MSRSPRSPMRPRVVRRTMSTAPGPSVLITVIVALIAGVASAAPVWFDTARTDTLRTAMGEVSPLTRDAGGTMHGMPLPHTGGDPWSAIDAGLATIEGRLPAHVAATVGEPHVVVSLPIGGASALNGDLADASPPSTVTLLATPDLTDRVRIVSGRAPQATAQDVTEVVASVAVAERLGWRVGERRRADANPDADLELVGTVEAVRAHDPAWAHTPTALQPATVIAPDGGKIVTASLFTVLPGIVPFAADQEEKALTEAWFPVDPDDVDVRDAARLSAELRALSAGEYTLDVGGEGLWDAGRLVLRSRASASIDEGLLRGSTMTAVVTTLAVGPLLVALVALALAGRMLADRRLPAMRLMRARGASWRRLAAILGGEGLLLGAVGVILATTITTVAVGWAGAPILIVGAALALAPAVIVTLVVAARMRVDGRQDLGSSPVLGRSRRLAIEACILALSAVVVWLVLARAQPTSDLDPVLLAVPIALAAAGSVFALRLVTLVLSFAERRGARSTALVPLLGPARARRDASVRVAPVLAVVVGICVTMFSVAFSETVAEGIRTESRAATGADLHVEAPYFSDSAIAEIRRLDGVDAVAPVYAAAREKLTGERSVSVMLFAVDGAEFRAVQRDLGSLALPIPPVDDGDDRVPLVVSADAAAAVGASDDPEIGRRGDVSIARSFAGTSPFGNVDRWALVDRSRLSDLVRQDEAPTQLFIALTPGADLAEVRAHMDDLVPSMTAVTPAQLERERAGDPALSAIRAAVVVAMVLVAVLLGAAVAMTLVLGSHSRGRLLALLRTMGYRRRGELPLVTWEVAPALACALPFGIAAGAAMSWIVTGAIDLRSFVGGAFPPAVQSGMPAQLIVVGGFLLTCVAAVVCAALIATRITSAAAVRSVEVEDR